jgi:GNAT superfamily N-acetyltransferase
MPFSVELASQGDMPAVLALVEELLAELGDEGREFHAIDRNKMHGDLGSSLISGRFLPLLAKNETGVPIGVLTLSVSFAVYAGGDHGTIDEMYVKPEQRNRGVGKAMVAKALGLARERRWFRLDVTGPEGPEGDASQALRFYENLGFEFTGPKLRKMIQQ